MNHTLIEYFSAHETLNDMDTTSPDKFKAMIFLMESLAGPMPKGDVESIPAWDSKWRAKLRFIRAKAMAEEAGRIRKESEPELETATMVHPLFGTVQWEEYVKSNWERVMKGGASEQDMEHCRAVIRQMERRESDTKTTNLSFSEALEAMKSGKKARRPRWTEQLLTIENGAVVNQDGSEMALFSCCDLLANDWEVVI